MKKYLQCFLFLCYFASPLFLWSQTDYLIESSLAENQDAYSPSTSPITPSRSIESTYPLIYSDTENPASHLPETDSFQAKFFNMLFVLGLLIGFMILASYMLKRMMHSRVTQINDTSVVKVLETRTLSPRTTLYLLDVQGKKLLIAESPTGASVLTTLASDTAFPST